MASTVSTERRTTRSSTQTQTTKSYDDAQARKSLGRTKGTGAIDKQKAKKSARAKAASKPKAPKAPTKRKPISNKGNSKDPGPQSVARSTTSTSVPDNVTIFNISTPLLKTPITCHKYVPPPKDFTASSPYANVPLIFTHGAGGTLLAPAVLNFCTGFSSVAQVPLVAFQGSMNLGARVKAARRCFNYILTESRTSMRDYGVLFFGGRSMGARAAVIAAAELLRERKANSARLVLVSYPLQGPKDVRDQILLDLPKETEVLFIVGDRDAMCPLDLLEEVRSKMVCKSRVVVVKGADHGMNVRPQSKTKEVGEETGRMAASIGYDGETLYIGETEET